MPIKVHTKNISNRLKNEKLDYDYDIYRALKPKFIKNEEANSEIFGKLDTNIIENLEQKNGTFNLL